MAGAVIYHLNKCVVNSQRDQVLGGVYMTIFFSNIFKAYISIITDLLGEQDSKESYTHFVIHIFEYRVDSRYQKLF